MKVKIAEVALPFRGDSMDIEYGSKNHDCKNAFLGRQESQRSTNVSTHSVQKGISTILHH